MMRKIVNHQYSPDFPLHVHSTLHAAKRRERLGNHLGADPAAICNRHRCHRVHRVVPPRRHQRKFPERFCTVSDTKSHLVAFHRKVARNPIVRGIKSVRLDRTQRFLSRMPQRGPRLVHISPDHHSPSPRHQIDQASKRKLIGLKIGIDVRVIVFERSNDQIVWMIMKELWPPIPERRLILVAFENEFRAATQSVTLPKILRHAPHKKVRLLPCRFENPCQHRRGRGLSVGPADDDRVLPRQTHFLQYLRQRAIRDFSVEHLFEFGIPTRDNVANDRQIRRRLHVRRIKRIEKRDPQAFEKCGSRRIHPRIRTRHAVPALAQHPRQRRHRRSANSNQVHMFAVAQATTAGSKNSSVPSPSASSRASIPKGTVSKGRGVCPTGAPNTRGTPSGRRIRAQTSRTVADPTTVGSLSGNSPKTIPRTPSNFPACFRCISTRSTWYGFMARSSKTSIESFVSNSHGVPMVASSMVMHPPRTLPTASPASIGSPLNRSFQPASVRRMACNKEFSS